MTNKIVFRRWDCITYSEIDGWAKYALTLDESGADRERMRIYRYPSGVLAIKYRPGDILEETVLLLDGKIGSSVKNETARGEIVSWLEYLADPQITIHNAEPSKVDALRSDVSYIVEELKKAPVKADGIEG